MGLLLFFIVLFVILVGGGWLMGKAIGSALFPSEKKETYTFVNHITHVHHHEHKHISLIDEQTKKVVKDYLIDKKASN